MRTRHQNLVIFASALTTVLGGCGGDNDTPIEPFVGPPAPIPLKVYVVLGLGEQTGDTNNDGSRLNVNEIME